MDTNYTSNNIIMSSKTYFESDKKVHTKLTAPKTVSFNIFIKATLIPILHDLKLKMNSWTAVTKLKNDPKWIEKLECQISKMLNYNPYNIETYTPWEAKLKKSKMVENSYKCAKGSVIDDIMLIWQKFNLPPQCQIYHFTPSII